MEDVQDLSEIEMPHNPECGEEKGAEAPGEGGLSTHRYWYTSYSHKHVWRSVLQVRRHHQASASGPPLPAIWPLESSEVVQPIHSSHSDHRLGLTVKDWRMFCWSRQTSLSTGAELVHVFALWRPPD